MSRSYTLRTAEMACLTEGRLDPNCPPLHPVGTWVCLLTMVVKGVLGPMWGLTSLYLSLEKTITSGLKQVLLLCGADE